MPSWEQVIFGAFVFGAAWGAVLGLVFRADLQDVLFFEDLDLGDRLLNVRTGTTRKWGTTRRWIDRLDSSSLAVCAFTAALGLFLVILGGVLGGASRRSMAPLNSLQEFGLHLLALAILYAMGRQLIGVVGVLIVGLWGWCVSRRAMSLARFRSLRAVYGYLRGDDRDERCAPRRSRAPGRAER
jgi:hypothetical protein